MLHKHVLDSAMAAHKLCFFGDSQTREMMIPTSPWDPGKKHRAKWFHYSALHFAKDPTAVLQVVAAQNCDHVLVNFGQWPGSNRAIDKPWSPVRYGKAVKALMAKLTHACGAVNSRRRCTVHWMTTNGHPLIGSGYTAGKKEKQLPSDWRGDLRLWAYNRIAREVLKNDFPSVSVIDTWQITWPVEDLAMDSHHYSGRIRQVLRATALENVRRRWCWCPVPGRD